MKLRQIAILTIGFVLVTAGVVYSQQYNTSGGWYSSDTRRTASTTDHLGLGVVGDAAANDRYVVRADGQISWGGGSGVPDVVISRASANTLALASGDTLTATMSVADPLTFSTNSESLLNSADATFDFTRNDAGVVTLTASDDNAVAALTVTPGGAAAMILGSGTTTTLNLTSNGAMTLGAATSDTMTLIATGAFDIGNNVATAVTIDTDGTGDAELVLPLQSVAAGEILNDTIDGSELVDAITLDADLSFTGGDVSVLPSETVTFGAPNKMLQSTLATGFALHSQYVGIPKLGVTHMATLTNGTTSTAVATPLLGACSAVVNGTETDDTAFFVTGAASYKYVWQATVAENDGIDCVIAYPAVTDPIRLGFWFRSDVAIVSGDIDINFDDGGVTDGTYSTFATTVVDEWQWVELDITTACAAECASVDGIEFLATAQAAAGSALDGVSMYIDQLAMWKAADETAIGDIRVGGLVDFTYAPKANTSANTLIQGVEWTSHFITYQSGADAVISITDLSAQYGTTLEALN